jgi:hypothetical protein
MFKVASWRETEKIGIKLATTGNKNEQENTKNVWIIDQMEKDNLEDLGEDD